MADIDYDDVIGYIVRIERTRLIEQIVGPTSGDMENDEEEDEEVEP